MPFTKESHDEKTIKYLLGPMKDLPEDERMILNHAKYCDILNFDKKKKSEQDNTIDTSNLLFIPHTTFPKVFIRQTYKMWKAAMDIGWRLRKAKKRRVIYIQPLEEFPEFISKFEFDSTVGFFEFLKRFTSLFFGGFLVRLLEPLDMDAAGWNITTRTQKITGQKQFLVTDIQKRLQKALPKDGFCILGITWTDLYPSDGLNFVFGDANSAYSSGVFSFGRFEPRRFKEGNPPIPIEHIDGYLIWKMIKVVSHETCHVFGLAHCVFFDCAMNESTSMEQAMAQPLFLCPVCLKKIRKICKYPLCQRYRDLLTFLQTVQKTYTEEHIGASVDWLQRALEL